jgi:hypothetical protein
MLHPEFEAGVSDVRKGVPPRFDLDSWEYERGRQWACLAPRSLPLKRNGRITAAAFRLYIQNIDLIP